MIFSLFTGMFLGYILRKYTKISPLIVVMIAGVIGLFTIYGEAIPITFYALSTEFALGAVGAIIGTILSKTKEF